MIHYQITSIPTMFTVTCLVNINAMSKKKIHTQNHSTTTEVKNIIEITIHHVCERTMYHM
jgi:hypothetical protein